MTHPEYTPEQLQRFWSKVNKSSGKWWNGTECWEWTASQSRAGYGYFRPNRKTLYAHRLSFEIANGVNNGSLWVLHHCDNPACVRPEHLFLGTVQDNTRDMIEKGRQATGDRHGSRTHPESRLRGDAHPLHRRPELAVRGELQGSAKLTADKVRLIREMYAEGRANQVQLASLFQVNQATVWRVIKRLAWQHVD